MQNERSAVDAGHALYWQVEGHLPRRHRLASLEPDAWRASEKHESPQEVEYYEPPGST
jgi:hypothetical protein